MGNGGYLRRIEALEARVNVGTCGTRPCLKCALAALPVVQVPGVESDDTPVPAWTGCDGYPVHTLTELLRGMEGKDDDKLSGKA